MLSEREFVAVTSSIGLCRYLNRALFQKVSGGTDTTSFLQFKNYWDMISSKYFTDEAIAFAILKQTDTNSLTKADISVAVQGIVYIYVRCHI
jgi:hypothetical protein